MTDLPLYVVYVCECGNYVAEPTVELAAREVAHNVRIWGAVYCAAPTHGTHQPEMRRVVLEEQIA